MNKKEIFNRINDLIKTCDIALEDSEDDTDNVFYLDKQALLGIMKMYKDLEIIEEAHREENGKLNEKMKDLEADLTSVYISGVYDERERWLNKIKANREFLGEEAVKRLLTSYEVK